MNQANLEEEIELLNLELEQFDRICNIMILQMMMFDVEKLKLSRSRAYSSLMVTIGTETIQNELKMMDYYSVIMTAIN